MSEKNLEKLEALLKKEQELAEKHKQKAKDIQDQIEMARGNLINKTIMSLNLNHSDFEYLMMHLKNKKSIGDSIESLRQHQRKEGQDVLESKTE